MVTFRIILALFSLTCVCFSQDYNKKASEMKTQQFRQESRERNMATLPFKEQLATKMMLAMTSLMWREQRALRFNREMSNREFALALKSDGRREFLSFRANDFKWGALNRRWTGDEVTVEQILDVIKIAEKKSVKFKKLELVLGSKESFDEAKRLVRAAGWADRALLSYYEGSKDEVFLTVSR